MKKLIIIKGLTLLLLLAATASWAQFKPAEQGSTLKFTIKNLGFGVDGAISGFDGSINFDPQNLAAANFDVTLNPATINTDNSLRDEHLKGDSFFDVKNYPRIRLTATDITPGKSGTYMLNGKLTIKGVTKPITFPFTAAATIDGYVFKGAFKMKRKDFGVGGTSTVSDELDVMLNVAAKRTNPI
jgi:polyisoprenoid-binding protein YceI